MRCKDCPAYYEERDENGNITNWTCDCDEYEDVQFDNDYHGCNMSIDSVYSTLNALRLQKLKESKDVINKTMSNYVTSIDPCGMCRHRDHTNVTDICGQCCYYWGSMFDLDTKKQENNKGVRHE